jgi:hypothetical protein
LPAGRIYVALPLQNAITAYPADATDPASPAITITGPDTGLNAPVGVATGPPPPLAVTTALPAAQAGVPYTGGLTITGGIAPYQTSVTAGALPAGLTLDPATGAITGTPTSNGTSTFTVAVTDSAIPAATVTKTVSIAVANLPGVYVADNARDALTEYALAASGNTPPELTLSGPDTGLDSPDAVALDGSGRVYAANQAAGTVTEYGAGARGDSAPLATITNIADPQGVTVDGAGDVFVSSGTSVIEYPPGANGPAAANRIIPDQAGPSGLALDATGNLYVAEYHANSVEVYALHANGTVTLLRTLTGLAFPDGIVIGPNGNLTVANSGNGPIDVFAPGASGNATPLQTLSAGLEQPVAVDRGSDNTLYAGDLGLDALVSFAPGASTPTATISGPATDLGAPLGVAATPPLSILLTTTLPPATRPPATRHHGYLTNLTAAAGATPYRWRLARGRLPRGLRLDPSGAITGIPRHRTGVDRFTVAVTDSSRPRQQVTQTLQLRVRR